MIATPQFKSAPLSSLTLVAECLKEAKSEAGIMDLLEGSGQRRQHKAIVVEWSVEKVGDFVRSVGKSAAWDNHASIFMENGIDGAVLVNLIMEYIVDDMGINRMFARTLHAAIRRL
uniref:SAM domain-containing protein n=1 Tax=Lotharella oceanica TaxID=641309 RepID=A0A7S2X8Q1_9EUKA|mmetsp:Transcript_18229/g.34515  ORF Transcript_18229/g.34515 Transcript_18229/m.34515 type:complete len:116 (+) Transcript_18229:701-1048(+)